MGSVATKQKKTKTESELFEAIHRHDFTKAKQLIESGVSVNCLNIYGATPLIETCRTISKEEQYDFRKEFVEYLLRKGCNTSKKDVYKTSAYLYAIQQNNDKIVQLLDHIQLWASLCKGKKKQKRRVSINDYLTLYDIIEIEEDQGHIHQFDEQ